VRYKQTVLRRAITVASSTEHCQAAVTLAVVHICLRNCCGCTVLLQQHHAAKGIGKCCHSGWCGVCLAAVTATRACSKWQIIAATLANLIR
jgi:hypothetical protein